MAESEIFLTLVTLKPHSTTSRNNADVAPVFILGLVVEYIDYLRSLQSSDVIDNRQ
jgi:hypothetical protein